MPEVAQLLTAPANYAVVQLPSRRFPGVVFQGDSLNALVVRIEGLRAMAPKEADGNWKSELKDLIDELKSIRLSYERVLKENDIELPYPPHGS